MRESVSYFAWKQATVTAPTTMEPLEEDEAGTGVNTYAMESWHQLPAEEDVSHVLGETLGLPNPEHQHRVIRSTEGQISSIGDSSIQPVADRVESLQLELQDSCLSPALTLIPDVKTFEPSESTLLHQTDLEFVPLRGTPDLSMTSEKYSQISQLIENVDSNLPDRSHDQVSLSQHPLVVTASDSEGASNCCSLSQHSLLPSNNNWEVLIHDETDCTGLENRYERQMEGAEKTDADLDKKESVWNEALLSSRLPVHAFPTLLEKNVGVAGSSAVSSKSETIHTHNSAVQIQPRHPLKQSEHFDIASELNLDSTSLEESKLRPSGSREQPQGASSSSVFQRRTTGSAGVSVSSRMSAISNITFRSTNMQPDEITNAPHGLDQIHSDASVCAPGTKNQSESKKSAEYISPDGPGGSCLPGLQRALWSSGRNTGVDGSFLSSWPVSQSTPAVVLGKAAPVPSKLLTIYSHENTLSMSAQKCSQNTDQIPTLDLSATNSQVTPEGMDMTSLAPVRSLTKTPIQHQMLHTQGSPSIRQDVPGIACKNTLPDPATLASVLPKSDKMLEDQRSLLSAGRVYSLPSLSYLQKVDAWKANQSYSRSFSDDLALQGFDGVLSKRRANESVSETLNNVLSQQSLQHLTGQDRTSSAFSTSNSTPLSQPDGVVRHKDVRMTAGTAQPTSASPLTHSHSHSSLVTIVPAQQDGTQNDVQISPKRSASISPDINSAAAESSLLSGSACDQRPSDETVTNPVKIPSLRSFGQYSEMPANSNMTSTLSSCQGNYHGGESLRESLGAASSVVSLEVDNYAPYWTSRPDSPQQLFELNIEDRIPVYLRNLGIDQSPSKILNPFIRRGPIREPEFSPTDLCTIKGSVGTPTKSTQASEGGSPQKESFSSSSVLSADSSASLTHRLAVQKPDRPASPGSVRMARCQTGTPPVPHTSQPACTVLQESDTAQQESRDNLLAQLSLESAPNAGMWLGVKEEDSTFVGSETLKQIRRLLGQAGSLVSGHSSPLSSPNSHCYSESDASSLSLKKNTLMFHDDSSLSVDGRISLILAHSSSDSAVKESSSSSCGALQLSAHADHVSIVSPAPSPSREENQKSRDLRVAPRRAEPEGCSAADPDKVGPVSLSTKQVNDTSISDAQQHSQGSVKNAGVSSTDISPTHSPAEVDLGVLRDSSNEGSLSARVTKVLQSESPVSVVSSRSSSTESEESRARECIIAKMSDGQFQVLNLHPEDRKKIEEIKRELLLQIKLSSDSESSAQSSVGTSPQPTVDFEAVRSAKDRLTEQLQRASRTPLDSVIPQYTPMLQSVEDKVHQIALREGIRLTPPLTVATTGSKPSPQPEIQCLYMHSDHDTQNNSVPDSADTSVRLAETVKLQTEDKSGATESKGMETAGEYEEGKDEDKHQDINRTSPSADQEVALENVTGKTVMAPVLESDSINTHKPQMFHIPRTISPKTLQNIAIRPHSPASDACSNSELEPSSHDHQLDRMSSQNTSTGISPPAISPSEDQPASVSSETSLIKVRGAGQSQNTTVASSYSQITSRYRHAYTLPQGLADPSNRPLSFPTAAIPKLLPYKPHGSSELFYMPQADPELSPNSSETTVESSHPGSDDAVPPRFTTEVLGSRELEDNSVIPKHKEGIYSKRVKMKSECTVSGKRVHVSEAVTCNQRDSRGPYRLTASGPSVVPERDQVALQCSEEEAEHEAFVPLNMGVDYSRDNLPHQNHVIQKHNMMPENPPIQTKAVCEEEQVRKAKDLGVEIDSSLDQLWRRFNDSWSLQETRSTNKGKVSLVERLERLSRLLHSSSPPHTPVNQVRCTEERVKGRKRETEQRRAQDNDSIRREVEDRCDVRRVPKTVWEKEPSRSSQTLVDDEQQENDYRFPAERDESVSVSVETSISRSTIDTQRLLRAFGRHRVSSGQEEGTVGQQTSGSLLKLYNTINKQREDQDKASSEHLVSVATETNSTDDSTASVDLSSSSTYTLPSERCTKRTSSTKRGKVKLVNRGIQAGDFEIVVNGTRSHTRDVGTTFPSPGCVRNTRASPTNSELLAVSAHIAPAQAKPVSTRQAFKNKQTCCPNGLSWFVNADELKEDARKENKPQVETMLPEGQAWFEPYNRVQPWREPLRELHIQMEREKPPVHKSVLENGSSFKQSALVCLSLQEALELHRPAFVSRSRERMKRLCLLAEERRMQAVFNREREELFNRPSNIRQSTAGPVPALAPAPAPSKRVIPVSEMVQRSKRIYSQLPEVQKRKQEEKRKTEYSTYRLNAKLFNKKVTNRVLGRRAPWQ